MKLYLAGPMTGIPELNFPAFHDAAAKLRAQGHEVVNPAEINGGADELTACASMTEDELQAHWITCMRRDIAQLVTCDGMALLDGYNKSRGAMLEMNIAQNLGFDVRRVAAWLPVAEAAA